MVDQGSGAAASPTAGPLGDPVTESRRLVTGAAGKGLTVRLLGGVAVFMQAPVEGPLLPRRVGDIDLAIRREGWRDLAGFLKAAGYVSDDMFNALHGTRRLLFYDQVNGRKLDVFVGEFAMCHQVPIADRLDREPLTVPLAELLMTKLQIVQLTERDQRDIYNLVFHHDVTASGGDAIEADYVGELCARDWGLWRTAKATIGQCQKNVADYQLPPAAVSLIAERLDLLWAQIEATPKTARWRMRNRVGDRMRWYNEPEENAQSK